MSLATTPTSFVPSRDPVELLLRGIARRAIAGTLLGSAAAVLGCAAPDGPAGADAPADAELLRAEAADAGAADGGNHLASLPWAATNSCNLSLRGLAPDAPWDYVSVRRFVPGMGILASDPWNRRPYRLLGTSGTPCVGATSDACETKLALDWTTFSSADCGPDCSTFVVTTRGEQVEAWLTPEDVKRLLGPIDSAADATLRALTSSLYDQACARSTQAPGSDAYVVDAYDAVPGQRQLVTYHRLQVARDGSITVLASELRRREPSPAVGRRPEHLVPSGARAGASPLGSYLAACAALEAASVPAFEQLVRELEAHGAPATLIARARAARMDEVRHARVVGSLARAHGGWPSAPEVRPQPARGLEQMARENGVEGCVRETYGALMAAHQAAHARDAALRDAMARIGEDEARHAALAHAVDAWIMPQLTPAARARVRAAKLQAIATLAAEVRMGDDPELAREAGLPPAELGSSMLDALARSLWRTDLTVSA